MIVNYLKNYLKVVKHPIFMIEETLSYILLQTLPVSFKIGGNFKKSEKKSKGLVGEGQEEEAKEGVGKGGVRGGGSLAVWRGKGLI